MKPIHIQTALVATFLALHAWIAFLITAVVCYVAGMHFQ